MTRKNPILSHANTDRSAGPGAEAAWAAVVARDRAEDGVFVYAVSSTGIYCRPSCPSRRPRRANVTFYKTPDDAEGAGYRECRRCRPRSAAGAMIDICVNAARAYLDAHLDETITLQTLATHVGVSPFHLQRAFKVRIGLSPKAYVNARRLEQFKKVAQNGATVTEAMYEAGFGSPRGLYERASAALGMTPAVYRRRGAGVEIRYTFVPCCFGLVLIGTTDRGVCAVLLGSAEGPLVKELRLEFSRGLCTRDDRHLRPLATAVVAHVEGRQSNVTLPLDVMGSDFQRRVWATLQQIPHGETRSYGEIAEALGEPSATRAVARACAANKLAVVIPCHRVVRGDGALGGYRWGLTRKRELIHREQRSDAEGARAPQAGGRLSGRSKARSPKRS